MTNTSAVGEGAVDDGALDDGVKESEQLVQGTTLVVGTYPPIPGHAAAVTLAATRRAYAAGQEVVVVAPRPGAAHRTMAVVGPQAGERLEQARTEYGTRRLVLCVEAGMPVPVTPAQGIRGLGSRVQGARGVAQRQASTVAGLAEALTRFDHVTVVVAGDLGLAPELLAAVWPHVDQVLFHGEAGADREQVAAQLGLDPARLVDVAGAGDAHRSAAPVVDGAHPEVGILRQALAARTSAHADAGRPPGVTLFGPPEFVLRERPRQVISVGARTVLGPAAPLVRRGVVNVVRRARTGRGA